MGIPFKVPNYAYSLPWFIYDLFNRQLITSVTVPGSIADKKDVILTEVPIPGLNFSPIQPSGNGNRKISFVIPIVKRNNTIGNSLLIKQFQALRNQGRGLLSKNVRQFNPNPKVIYYWGTGSVPLVYFVKKCDLVNRGNWVNQTGNPKFTDVDIELWLDENDPTYLAEEMYRQASVITGNVVNNYDTFDPIVGGRQL